MIKYIYILFIVLVSCSSSGPVDTVQSDSSQEIVEAPKNYKSPFSEIKNNFSRMSALEERITGVKNKLKSPDWNTYLAWREAFELSESRQQQLENELAETGKIELSAGQSYTFDLDSFCVHSGKSRPVKGDGLRLAGIKGPALKYLPKILQKYGSGKYDQEKVQTLIWELLNDVRYDELDVQNQKLLKEFFPDAAVRFGSRKAENFIKSIIKTAVPEKMRQFREDLKEYQNNYKELEKVFAPKPARTEPIPVGWMKMDDGYYLKIHSIEDYKKVRVEIYVPEDETRSPAAISKKVFKPWEWIALPESGQRLVVSPKSDRAKKKPEIDVCSELKKWKPQNCKEMTNNDRDRILELADPVNFPKTIYQSPPKQGAKIEEETDCSHFAQEIYRRAGFEFTYSPTSTLACIQTFQTSEEIGDAEPGDIILFSGHVGIFNREGKVISSTIGGPQRRSEKKDDPKFKSSISINPIEDFTKKQKKVRLLKWKCI